MKKVLIISYNFPPVNNVASRRFSEMIPFFNSLGWESYVLTTNSEGDLVTSLYEENIFRIGQHPQGLTMKQGEPVLNGFFSQTRRRLGFSFKSFDSSYSSWYKPVISNNIVEDLKEINFDILIATYGPPAGLLVGSKLASILNIPWIADFRDLGALRKDDYMKSNFLATYFDKKYEKKVVKSASLITTVSKTLANELEKEYRKRTAVIYNGWIENYPIANNKDTFREENKPYIFYAGRFYHHSIAAIFLLLDSIKDEDLELVIRSLGPYDLEQEIINYARSKGVLSKLRILPPVEASIISKERESSILNLVIEDLNTTYESNKGVLTGKLMQLLTCKPPVLAIARKDSEIGDVLFRSKRGILATTAEEIKVFIRNVQAENTSYPIDLEAIDVYSKKFQASNLVKLMNNII